MKISDVSKLPSPEDLVPILNDAFDQRYSFRLFGLGKEKTIMVRKSALVGLQLSFDDKEVHFERTAPTIASSAFSFMMLTELIVIFFVPLLIISEGFTKDPYKEMAKEIGVFLKGKYPASATE